MIRSAYANALEVEEAERDEVVLPIHDFPSRYLAYSKWLLHIMQL